MIQLVLVGGICALIFTIIIGKSRFSRAAVFMESNPEAEVYLDGQYVGTTPIEIERDPGDVRIELIVTEDLTKGIPHPLVYTTVVELRARTKTIVRREFREDSGESFGSIIYFRNAVGMARGVDLITIPDNASIYVDGKFEGVTPLVLTSISKGNHTIEVEVEGYNGSKFDIQVVDGYQTVSYIELESADKPDESVEIDTDSDSKEDLLQGNSNPAI